MNVTLVYPYLNGPKVIPTGVIYLGTALKRAGISASLVDLTFDHSFQTFETELRKNQPDIVGISAMTIFIDYAFEAAKIAKHYLPDSTVVIGGPHATALPEETLQEDAIDIVVIGEGERTLTDLVKSIEVGRDLREVEGIYFKRDGHVIKTEPRPFIQNLDELGLLDWELLPTFPKYLYAPQSFPRLAPWVRIFASRGCPFNCAFCQPLLRKQFGRKVRHRSPEMVVSEIEALVRKYNIRSFYFGDDTFLASKKWVERFCKIFMEKGFHKRLRWTAQTNVNTITGEIAQMIKVCGCVFLAFGVESGNDFILSEVLNKGQTVEKIRSAFEICREAGILTLAALIIGTPKDTKETVRDTVRLMKEIKPDLIDTHFLTPTPGSKLYDEYRGEGILLYEHWRDPDRYTAGLLVNENLTVEELAELKKEIEDAWLREKSIFRINPLWFRWFLNYIGSSKVRNPTQALKLFQGLVLARNSSTWTKIQIPLRKMKRHIEGQKHDD